MINWEEYKFNEEHNLEIMDGDRIFELKVKITEYEWSLHRKPMLADVQIVESSDLEMYPLNSIMRLPMVTEDFVNFLLFAPIHMSPAREFKRKGYITLSN
jgi:hypothetical protein